MNQKNVRLFGFAIVAVATILHAYLLVLELRLIKEAHPFHADMLPGRLHIFLLLAFFVIALGLAVGRRAGLACSVLGLLGGLLVYVDWFSYSQKVLHAFNQDERYERHPELIPPNLWGFIGARWWDMVLLVFLLALFVWAIKMLFTSVAKRNPNEVGS